MDPPKIRDVLVLGGGNAALCAAITARETGASVLLVEAAPKFYRGGNTRHTRNFRLAHAEADELLTAPYPEDCFWEDLLQVTGGETDAALAKLAIAQSLKLRDWFSAHGVHFQPALKGTLNLSHSNAFFLGGGRAMLNALYRSAEKAGVEIAYDCEAVALDIRDGVFHAATLAIDGRQHTVRAAALVAATGGFEADLEQLRLAWGDGAENFRVRGTPYNRGTVLRMLLANGVLPVGDPAQCHAVAVDSRGPKFDGGIVTRLDCLPFGIVVDRDGRRFADEGEDIWPKRYAVWGRLVAEQPGQQAFVLFDAKTIGRFMPSLYPPITAGSIAELAQLLKLDGAALKNTLTTFNGAVQPGEFRPGAPDGCHTQGITPPKSNWAVRIDSPPFYAYPLSPGITFTYQGVRVNGAARMITGNGTAENMFAAGEIMAGNILGRGYIAGIGMTIGGVFGRLAGAGAAIHAVG